MCVCVCVCVCVCLLKKKRGSKKGRELKIEKKTGKVLCVYACVYSKEKKEGKMKKKRKLKWIKSVCYCLYAITAFTLKLSETNLHTAGHVVGKLVECRDEIIDTHDCSAHIQRSQRIGELPLRRKRGREKRSFRSNDKSRKEEKRRERERE